MYSVQLLGSPLTKSRAVSPHSLPGPGLCGHLVLHCLLTDSVPLVVLDPLDGEHDIVLLLVPGSPYLQYQRVWRKNLGHLPEKEILSICLMLSFT